MSGSHYSGYKGLKQILELDIQKEEIIPEVKAGDERFIALLKGVYASTDIEGKVTLTLPPGNYTYSTEEMLRRILKNNPEKIVRVICDESVTNIISPLRERLGIYAENNEFQLDFLRPNMEQRKSSAAVMPIIIDPPAAKTETPSPQRSPLGKVVAPSPKTATQTKSPVLTDAQLAEMKASKDRELKATTMDPSKLTKIKDKHAELLAKARATSSTALVKNANASSAAPSGMFPAVRTPTMPKPAASATADQKKTVTGHLPKGIRTKG